METIPYDQFKSKYGDIAASRFSTPQEESAINNVISSFKRAGKNIYEAAQTRGGQALDSGKRFLTGQQSLGDTTLQVLGAGAGFAGDVQGEVIKEGAKAILPKPAEDKLKGALSAVASNPAIVSSMEAYNKWKTANPVAAANIESVINIGSLIPAAKGAQIVGEGVETAAKHVVKTVGTVEKAAAPAVKFAKNAIEGAKPAPLTADTLAGMIAQGKKADIKSVKDSLAKIDVKDVTTYTELTKRFDDRIKDVSQTLDKALDTDTTKRSLASLSTKVGSTEHNFIEDGITQLENFYEKTSNIAKLDEIRALKARAQTEGLSVKDINDIARLHGKELNAYNANGELASGLSKQAAENTRMGMKDTARRLFGNAAYKAADQEVAKLMKTRDLVNEVAENVNKLKQRISERGWGEKIGRLVFQVADKFTGGGLKGFVQSFVPRGEGLKIMNALDLEKNLQKNLELLQKLNNPEIREADALKILQQIVNPPKPVKMVKVNTYNKKYPKYVPAP